MRDRLIAHLLRYGGSYLLAISYAALASIGAFIDIFSVLTREQAAAMPWWQHVALYAKCIVPGLTAMLAFRNQSISKAREGPPYR